MCICRSVYSSALCVPVRFIPWWLLNWLKAANKTEKETEIRREGGERSKERKGKERQREIKTDNRERDRLRQKLSEIKGGGDRYVHRGEWEASSNCSLGACWADSPLLRPHQQVTYLTHTAKNKNCWCVHACTPPPHAYISSSISFNHTGLTGGNCYRSSRPKVFSLHENQFEDTLWPQRSNTPMSILLD